MPSGVHTIGILGGGQLAMMLAQAGRRLGLSCVALDPDPNCPASHACGVVEGAYDDPIALGRLAAQCQAATYEFENVPAESVRRLSERVPVRPGAKALEVAQDRLSERRMFAELGIDAPEMRAVGTLDELAHAARAMLGEGRGGMGHRRDACATGASGGVILKSRRQGYDGKGQSVLRSAEDAERAWVAVGRVPSILDQVVPFVREVSVIATRGVDGSTVVYPLCENQHANGILCVTRAGGDQDPARRAGPPGEAAALRILDHLGYVGTMAVEFFEVVEGGRARLLANEIAPRVHNTGHWTIEGARTSQFENHMRAVAGMELGPTDALGHAAMVNIIGVHGPPAARAGVADAHWHDYHKAARAGRKLGHVTVVRRSAAERDAAVRAVLEAVGGVGRV